MSYIFQDWSRFVKHSGRLIILLLPLAASVMLLAACASESLDTPESATATTSPQPTSTSAAEGSTPDTTSSGQTESDLASTDDSKPTPTSETGVDQIAKGPIAPKLAGIGGWINTEPFTLESLRGKVVLIDFWTYTCVNCIRTFPFLREWHEKYAEHGLVIVGVHSPEFEFEEVKENVEAAAAQYDLRYFIVQDNFFSTWQTYSNHAWPSKYLIDKDGVIRYTHIGEGAYETTEQKIRELLAETGASIYQIPLGTTARPDRDPQAITSGEFGQTRELYAGYIRNLNNRDPYVGNPEYYYAEQDSPTLYRDPGDYANHLLYLQGLWTNGSESLTHARITENLEDYIGLSFHGTTVNVVVNYEGDSPLRVVVTLDGTPIPEELSGADVQKDDDGTSFFLIDEPRMYRVVELPNYGGHELKLSSNSDEFSVFAFTFGSYVEGP